MLNSSFIEVLDAFVNVCYEGKGWGDLTYKQRDVVSKYMDSGPGATQTKNRNAIRWPGKLDKAMKARHVAAHIVAKSFHHKNYPRGFDRSADAYQHIKDEYSSRALLRVRDTLVARLTEPIEGPGANWGTYSGAGGKPVAIKNVKGLRPESQGNVGNIVKYRQTGNGKLGWHDFLLNMIGAKAGGPPYVKVTGRGSFKNINAVSYTHLTLPTKA